MNDIEKARAWMNAHEGIGGTPLDYLAAYGAHCAREAEWERDALAAQVAELRATGIAVLEALKHWEDGEVLLSPVLRPALKPWREALAQPTAQRVQQVAAGMALAEAFSDYLAKVSDGDFDAMMRWYECVAVADRAYIAAKEAALAEARRQAEATNTAATSPPRDTCGGACI